MAEKSQPSSRVSSALSRMSTAANVMPGEIAEHQEEDPTTAKQYNTTMDSGSPKKQQEAPEPMAAQEEMAYQNPTERSANAKSKGKKKNKGEIEFDSLDPKDYGIDYEADTEEVYEPPSHERDLPDLHRLMASLDAPASPTHPVTLGDGDEPPSLFSHPDNVENYKKISELKLEIEEGRIGDYVVEFEEGVRDDVLMIGSIGLDDVQDEEKRLRDEHVRYLEAEALMAEQRRRKIREQEELAKKRAAQALWEKRQEIQRMEQLLQQKEQLLLDRLGKSFRRAENNLVRNLQKRKGEVKTYYGDLMTADGHYGGSRGRRWNVDWDKTPQPIQVKVKCLRGTKDKLPAGRYILMVSQYNRLGGHVMRWSNVKGQQWGGATLPFSHDGHFYNTEMKVDQSMFTVLPAKPGIRPGMVLMFELFLLRGSVVSTDRVVAWGTFPIADGTFNILQGKYQCPLLRGEMDPRIEIHDKIESLIASDLDHWLCNLYFEVVKLPRYLAGQKEYEVELQFSSGILAYPDRSNTGEDVHDGEEPVAGSLPDLNSRMLTDSLGEPSTSFQGSADNMNSSSLTGSDASDVKKRPLDDDSYTKKRPLDDDSFGDSVKKFPLPEDDEERGEVRKRRPFSTVGSRQVKGSNKVKVELESDTDYEDEEVKVMKKDEGFFPVKGHPGMFYKKHDAHPVDDYHRKLFTLLPETPLLTEKRRKHKKLTHLEQLDEHNFSVRELLNEKGRLPASGYEKVQYIRRQLLAELGLSQWRSREFWGMLLMFILVFFVRIYIHYVAQWVFLYALKLPVNKFDFLPYTVELNYQNTLLRTREEIGMILLGPMGNILVFVIFVLTSYILQRTLGGFPDIGSKFVIAFGIQAFLDPLLILIVDCALKRWRDLGGDNPIADFAKLYWHFYRSEGSGLAGIFITIFLYVFVCFMAGAILYMYFLRLHNNGRMLDIYWRLHGDEDIFFVPYDLEISNQELAYLVKKAEQWRGEEGERRKIAVYDYVWEEETVEETVWDENGSEVKVTSEGRKEVTTHVSIHTIHLDGLRELYRHFLRLPDGAIVEVFGDLAVAGMTKDMNDALAEGANKLENLDL